MAEAQSQVERAYDQVVEWLRHFEGLEDPRQSGKAACPRAEMLVQCLLAMLASANCWVEVAAFGKRKLDLPRGVSPRSRTARRRVPAQARLNSAICLRHSFLLACGA